MFVILLLSYCIWLLYICMCFNKPFWIWILNLSYRTTKIATFMGPTWGPPGSCRREMGLMFAPWTLLSGHASRTNAQVQCCASVIYININWLWNVFINTNQTFRTLLYWIVPWCGDLDKNCRISSSSYQHQLTHSTSSQCRGNLVMGKLYLWSDYIISHTILSNQNPFGIL